MTLCPERFWTAGFWGRPVSHYGLPEGVTSLADYAPLVLQVLYETSLSRAPAIVTREVGLFVIQFSHLRL